MAGRSRERDSSERKKKMREREWSQAVCGNAEVCEQSVYMQNLRK